MAICPASVVINSIVNGLPVAFSEVGSHGNISARNTNYALTSLTSTKPKK